MIGGGEWGVERAKEIPERIPSPSPSTAPAISIGLPVYNGAATIGRAIIALLGQTFADFELIISDNGSTDATEEICRDYARRDPRIRYVRQPRNRGPAPNFAFVLAEARGPLFMWAAADDHWQPEFLAANVEALQQNTSAIASVSRVAMPGLADAGTRPLVGPFVRKVRHLLRENAGNSRFYGLFRTGIICRALEEGSGSFIASDWAVVIAAARRGHFVEVDRLLMTRSTRGTSSSWRRQMDSLGVQGLSRAFPFYGFTKWLWRNMTWWEFLACLDLILLRNLAVTVHYSLEIVRGWRDRAATPTRMTRPA
jgi:glycosyltransferase involved in cell wall biosynthesis